MSRKFTYLLFLLLIVFSCKKEETDTSNAVARVYDSYLYTDDITRILPEDVKGNDSILLAKNYINRWIKEQLLIKKAEINLGEGISEIDELVKSYRYDLLVNKYKEEAVKQYLDTLVKQQDLDVFYEENKEIFKLNEELVKLKYIHFGNDILNPKEFKKLFKSNKQADLDTLRAREMQLKSYSLNDTTWVRLSDVRRKLSAIEEEDVKLILKNTRFLEKKDSIGVYLVAVKDVLKRNQTAPKSYITPTIRQMILHKRKLDLIKKIEETLVEDALNNQEFEIYEDK